MDLGVVVVLSVWLVVGLFFSFGESDTVPLQGFCSDAHSRSVVIGTISFMNAPVVEVNTPQWRTRRRRRRRRTHDTPVPSSDHA
jgi:hypothetical protein